jgi:hypothetical protein
VQRKVCLFPSETFSEVIHTTLVISQNCHLVNPAAREGGKVKFPAKKSVILSIKKRRLPIGE